MKILLVALMFSAFTAFTEPLAQVERDGVRIVLHSRPCNLAAITNLPHYAEWTQKGKTFSGCWMLNVFSLVVMYFDDQTVVTIPVQYFFTVQGV